MLQPSSIWSLHSFCLHLPLTEYDPVALWWVNLLFVAAYWQIGEEEKAETYISCIDSLPAELQKER